MILYHFIKHKKINGTLFYAFEYFVFLNKYKDTDLWLFDISDKNLEYIKNIFKDRYNFDHKLLDKIKSVHLKDFLKYPDKIIILDNRTYENLRKFFPKAKVLWHKTDSKNYDYQIEKLNSKDIRYGSYYYQKYDIEQHLQFHFDIYKPLTKSGDKIFISSLSNSLEQAITMMENKNVFINKNKIFFKDNINHTNNLFEEFSTFIYFKTEAMDTNNRLVVESYYYNKNIILVDDIKEDSVYFRLKELNEYGIDYFRLNTKNKMIEEYLDDSK
jgi:hypothetical protein